MGHPKDRVDDFAFTPLEFTEFAIKLKGEPIDLARRPWLPPIYNMPVWTSNEADWDYRRKLLLLFGRQSEKTVFEEASVIDEYGRRVPIKDVQVGDHIATMLVDNAHMGVRPVIWKSRRYRKRCVRVKTQMGHSLDLGYTHPVRQWNTWTVADELRPGDRIATVRRLADVSGEEQPDDDIALLGYMLSDGCLLRSSGVGFTQADGLVLDHFRAICDRRGWTYREYTRSGSKTLRFNREAEGLYGFFHRLGLIDHDSHEKFIPDAFMRLPLRQVRLLIESLWAGDGHSATARETDSDYEFVYCSCSKTLARQVQSLLWRLGVPSRVREQVHRVYENTEKRAYLVHLRTREGIEHFVRSAVVPGKSAETPTREPNDNRDTYPIEITRNIKCLEVTRTGPRQGVSLHTSGLRPKPKYPPTRRKLREYIEHFRTMGGYDQVLVDSLTAHVDTDLFWDEVVSVEDLGEQWCYDVEVEETHNFLVEGVVTHNSTTIGNLIIAMSVLNPYMRSLYVTASNTQMREFSDERLRAIINDSPVLKRMAGIEGYGDREVQNVLTKRWRNHSKVTLRSVYKNADRARGIPADLLCVDEIQDIHIDDLPVIEETLFHCELDEGPLSVYAGTPKTFDNPLEFYWSRHSTQNEWMVRCDCGQWILPDIVNIGPKGLLCHHCGRELNPVDGHVEWVRMGRENQEWEGFHLCQPVVVYAYRNKEHVFRRLWQEILTKKKRYNRQKFMNEVFGRSYDVGTKPVTLEEVRSCCLNGYHFVHEPSRAEVHTQSWAGIDWGEGDVSYSILSIWRYDSQGRFTCMFAKRYEGDEADSEYAVSDMIRICRLFKVNRIGSDWGFGFGTNSHLRKAFGAQKVFLFQHAGRQAAKVQLDKLGGKFTTHRTSVLSDVFTLIKRGKESGGVVFPQWDEFESFANDILSVYQEYSETARELVFGHPKGVPDDFLHTFCYAFLVSQFDHRRPDINAPEPSTKKFKRNS